MRRHFHGCVDAGEVRFASSPPFGVVAPQAAAGRIGASLRVARGVVSGPELAELQAELGAQPRTLSWGAAHDVAMSRSKRKFFSIEPRARASLLTGADRVRSASALDADLANAAPRRVCTEALARRMADHVGVATDGAELRGLQ
eukprot:3990719-Prymnesium_polylepis.1